MKFFKTIFILIVNILLIVIVFFLTEYCIYGYNIYIHNKNHSQIFENSKYYYMPLSNSNIYNVLKEYTLKSVRLPDGLKYNKNIPILLFGCSYAFGEYLEQNQIFSNKLSEELKRPVYNRGIVGGSFQHLYIQSISEELYKAVPKTNTIIYIMIGDHYRRTKLEYFNVLDYYPYLHFKIKNGNSITSDYKNNIKNFLRSLYTVKHLNHIYANKIVNNPANAEMITNEALLYFVKSREELQKHYGKQINFYIIFYEDWDILYSDILRKKLEGKGFKVISTKDLTDADLRISKYTMPGNNHPTEAAWNLLTPLIVKKLKI